MNCRGLDTLVNRPGTSAGGSGRLFRRDELNLLATLNAPPGNHPWGRAIEEFAALDGQFNSFRRLFHKSGFPLFLLPRKIFLPYNARIEAGQQSQAFSSRADLLNTPRGKVLK